MPILFKRTLFAREGHKMTGEDDNGTAADEPTPESMQPAPWLLATAPDLDEIDFEAPLVDSSTADSGGLRRAYEAALQSIEGDPLTTSAGRIFLMLHALTGMHFKPHERNEPFGPLMTLADGRRTAVPGDFRFEHIDLLAELASRTRNPVLRARIADICWLLDRKLGSLARSAVLAYTEVVEKVDTGELEFPHAKQEGVLHSEARGLLRRALTIGRSVGWDKPEVRRTRDIAIALRRRAVKDGTPIQVNWFSELDLAFRLSDPAEVARDLEAVLATIPMHINPDPRAGLWRLAADAYGLGKREDDKNRCLSEAAECMAAAAEGARASGQPAILAAHRLSGAIAQLHGVPGKKERRRELQHQLIDAQASIPDEMSQIFHEMDLREVVESAEKALEGKSLLDKLFIFASVTRSPDPEVLIHNAKELICQHPLSSLIPTSHHDREGKVIHRSQGGLDSEDAIRKQIALGETIRRRVVSAPIEAVRTGIVEKHYLSDEVLICVLRHSPFVPDHLLATFARGFLRFFQGDYASAVYILTPLLENSLRHVLKLNGYDVTIFDDATQTQQDRTISSLFDQMRSELEAVFSTPIICDIENVFLSKPGSHLRHVISHGLAHDATPYDSDAVYGCWLIFHLCMLPLFRYRAELGFPSE
jgi:hypothetical protein